MDIQNSVFHFDLIIFNSCKIQNITKHRQKFFSAYLNFFKVSAKFFCFLQMSGRQICIANDCIHRSSDVMRHIEQK